MRVSIGYLHFKSTRMKNRRSEARSERDGAALHCRDNLQPGLDERNE